MASSVATSFPQFALLPAEIQLQIWDSTVATLRTRQMHIFDVQAPPPSTKSHPAPSTPPRRAPSHRRALSRTRSRSRSQSPGCTTTTTASKSRVRKPSSRNGINLAALPTVTLAPFTCPASFDPSTHTLRTILRATSIDAARAVQRFEAAIPSADRGVVALDHHPHRIVYDSARDVLHLRFLPSAGDPLSAIFRALWSPALASALHGARRVAIDVAQIWPALAEEQQRLVQDVVFLACTLQNALEVLYLVDYSQASGVAKALGRKDSELCARFHSYSKEREMERAREGDVIRGNGTVWREVFDLEGLGWHERHPGFVFGEMFGEVIRLQQGQWFGEGEKKATFQGVRVLVAKNELGGAVDSGCMDES